jgi:tetratricopeptide (TPR) repeat protein
LFRLFLSIRWTTLRAKCDPTFLRSIPFAKTALLIALCVFAYLPAIRSGYIWDDDAHVTRNTTLHDLDGLRRMWFNPSSLPQYYPLVHTTFWIEYHLWQLDPIGYHIDNVLLHLLAALLLWRLLVVLGIPGAWLAAGIFLLHPIEVESVAWITERKNVLSTVFILAAALAYLRFEPIDSPNVPQRWPSYVAACAFFIAALLSKTVTCTFPVVMLILLWWKEHKLDLRRILPLIPLALLGLAFGIATALLEREHVGAQGGDWMLSPIDRLLVAGRILWFYPYKLLAPWNLIFIYPRWNIDAGRLWEWIFPLSAAGVFVALWLLRRRIGRGPFAAAACFIVLLFPALGFFNVYPMRYSFVADHFQYLAGITLIVLLAAGLAKLADRRVTRLVPSGIAVCLLIVLAVTSWRRAHLYRNGETLWRDTIVRNPSSWIAYNNLGELLERESHDSQAALPLFQRCWDLRPDWVSGYNLATAETNLGDYDAAIADFRNTISLAPQDSAASALIADLATAMGNRLSGAGRLREAQALYEGALRLVPNRVELLNNLAWLLAVRPEADSADHARSVELANQALSLLGSDQPAILDTLAAALASVGKFDDALETEQRALQKVVNEPDAGLRTTLQAHARSFDEHHALRESHIEFSHVELSVIDR